MHSPCVRKIVYDIFLCSECLGIFYTAWSHDSWLTSCNLADSESGTSYILISMFGAQWFANHVGFAFLLPYDIYCGICLFTIFMYTQLLDRYQPCPCLLGTAVALVQWSHQKPVHVEYLKRSSDTMCTVVCDTVGSCHERCNADVCNERCTLQGLACPRAVVFVLQ